MTGKYTSPFECLRMYMFMWSKKKEFNNYPVIWKILGLFCSQRFCLKKHPSGLIQEVTELDPQTCWVGHL